MSYRSPSTSPVTLAIALGAGLALGACHHEAPAASPGDDPLASCQSQQNHVDAQNVLLRWTCGEHLNAMVLLIHEPVTEASIARGMSRIAASEQAAGATQDTADFVVDDRPYKSIHIITHPSPGVTKETRMLVLPDGASRSRFLFCKSTPEESATCTKILSHLVRSPPRP